MFTLNSPTGAKISSLSLDIFYEQNTKIMRLDLYL